MNLELKAELERDEGKRLEAYQDSLGYWTIGVGHLLGSERRMLKITEAECAALLAADITAAETLARQLVSRFDLLTPRRQRALINMAFNLGGRLRGFKNFLAAVEREDWPEAMREMYNSLWAKQVGKRATRLAQMLQEG